MLRRFRFLAIVALVIVPACGGGGDDEPPPGPTPLATATILPTAAPTPTPEPTATPPAFPEVQLAAGISYSSPTEQMRIFRNDGSGWEGTRFDPPRLALLRGVTFSSPDVAWAFGLLGDYESPVLFRSDDAGRTWMNVTPQLPPSCKGLEDLAFVNADVGYAISRGVFGPRAAFVTRDAGWTWRRADVELPPVPLMGSYALGTRGATAELLSHDPAGTNVTRLDDPASPSFAFDGAGAIGGNNAFGTAGLRGWVATILVTQSAIFSSPAPGEPWIEQSIMPARVGQILAIDVRDKQNGVAGGRFAFLVMTDEGRSWREAVVTGLPDGWAVRDVLRLRGDGATAIATHVTSDDVQSAFFRSSDGGQSWVRDPTAVEDGVRLIDLARNTEVD